MDPANCEYSDTTKRPGFLDLDLAEAIQRLAEAVKERRKLKGHAAGEAEKAICVETRSLFVVFKDITISRKVRRAEIELVRIALNQALTTLSLDATCIASVKRRISSDFEGFLEHALAPDPSNDP